MPETSPLHFFFSTDVNSLNGSLNAFRILMKTHALPEGSVPQAALSHCPAPPAPAVALSNKSCACPRKLVYLQNFIHNTVEEGAYKARERALQMPLGNILLEYVL